MHSSISRKRDKLLLFLLLLKLFSVTEQLALAHWTGSQLWPLRSGQFFLVNLYHSLQKEGGERRDTEQGEDKKKSGSVSLWLWQHTLLTECSVAAKEKKKSQTQCATAGMIVKTDSNSFATSRKKKKHGKDLSVDFALRMRCRLPFGKVFHFCTENNGLSDHSPGGWRMGVKSKEPHSQTKPLLSWAAQPKPVSKAISE